MATMLQLPSRPWSVSSISCLSPTAPRGPCSPD